MYDFDKKVNRSGYSCIKWDRETTVGDTKNLLPFSVADMDFQTFPGITQALQQRVEHGCFGYTFAPDSFFASCIRWCKSRYDLDVKKEEIISCPGIVPTFAYLLNHMTNPGDQILLATPHYDPFFHVIQGNGRTKVTTSLVRRGQQDTFDFDDMEAKMKRGVKMFVLSNPHNPTGRVWTVAELTKIVQLCQQYQVLLFADEIHCDIILGQRKHTSIFQIPGSESCAILAQSPGKTFNIAGLKTATLIVKNPLLCQQIKAIIMQYRTAINLFGWTATTAAYNDGAPWVEELLVYLRENATCAVDYFHTYLPKINAYVPEATFLLWLDCRAYHLPQNELMELLATKGGVRLNDGSHYGDEGVGFVRMNIATQRETLLQGLAGIRRALESLA